ncbi:1,4-beta-xylanase [Cryobacterium lactosi]|uniref:1,4-beta-xylanase n=1 Tax=Cryobacterium lactosi TaxID=1259202 RepID=A0A4R9BH16_9MICO|nr:family 43 glycosylhydrolase [Cryobacterium lactosi]TFD84013.1 1,4-beta-xylanase [Cryobacterium lactosi]
MTQSRVICNPLDLAYAYSDVRSLTGKRSLSREAADPSVVLFRGSYFMFASMTPGFFHSDDLVSWTLQRSDKFPAYDYAPDVREVDGALIISASRRGKPSPFYRSRDPLADDFVEITPGTFAFWDPNLFQDDDGRLYLYWGCDARVPLQGVELDPTTFEQVGTPKALISSDRESRGWERNGENHDPKKNSLMSKLIFGGRPFIEGAWVTKQGNTYYLQYSAPATELNTYADGYYTSKSPLGPYEYSMDSPFSSKPGGFITGAGHGSTFQDEHGNWWHASTMRISVNQTYERRVGLFPAGFDEDGTLFCNQNFADYPSRVPDGPFDPWDDIFAGWMLLSYRKPVAATSSQPGHGPGLAVNENVRDWWVAGISAPGESLTVDLGATVQVHAVQVNLADHDLTKITPAPPKASLRHMAGHKRLVDPATHPTEYVLESSEDGESWSVHWDGRGTGQDTPHKMITIENGTPARYVRVIGHAMPFDAPLALSGIRVFGRGVGSRPAPVEANAVRLDPLTASVSWREDDNADGYNVRYGRQPGKLYHSWLVYGQSALNLSSLNAGEKYWVAVDAFNENGITAGAVVAISAQTTESRVSR